MMTLTEKQAFWKTRMEAAQFKRALYVFTNDARNRVNELYWVDLALRPNHQADLVNTSHRVLTSLTLATRLPFD